MVYKRYPRVTFTDGTTCSAGSDCPKHAGRPIAVTKEQKAVAKKLADERRQEKLARAEAGPTANELIMISQWDSALNEGKTLSEVPSAYRATWKCPVAPDHIWFCTVSKRRNRGDGCSCCSGHKASSTNNLRDFRPEIAVQLNEEKTGLKTHELTAYSNRMCIWNCKNGHEWSSTPNNRVDDNCPECMIWERSLANRAPHLVAEFDEVANGITADRVPSKDIKNYQWKCIEKGHTWPASTSNRTASSNSKCPHCTNRRMGEDNSLAFLYPSVASLIADKDLDDATQIPPGSAKVINWLCPTGDLSHIHEAPIRDKTGLSHGERKAAGCPFCSNHRLSSTNNLAFVNPGLALEFDFRRNAITADKIIAGTNTLYWWICLKGHKGWKTSPNARISKETGCPKCNPWSTSKPENAFRVRAMNSTLLTSIEEDHNAKLQVPWNKNRSMSVDIVGLVSRTRQQIVLEYDGSYFHNNDVSRRNDRVKTEALLGKGYLVVRIRENSLEFLDMPDHDNLLQLNHKVDTKNKMLESTFQLIEKWILTRS